MKEKADKTSEKQQRPSWRGKKWHCPICGAIIWLNNTKRHTQTKKHNDANYVLSEKFENKLASLSYCDGARYEQYQNNN